MLKDAILLQKGPLLAPMRDATKLHPFFANLSEEFLVTICTSKTEDLKKSSMGGFVIITQLASWAEQCVAFADDTHVHCCAQGIVLECRFCKQKPLACTVMVSIVQTMHNYMTRTDRLEMHHVFYVI